jgi:hypothetical protein
MNAAAVATLKKAEAKAWNFMMSGSELDARTVRGEEGKNYIAWCAAADALREATQKLAA